MDKKKSSREKKSLRLFFTEKDKEMYQNARVGRVERAAVIAFTH